MTEPTCPIADSDTDVRYLVGSLSAVEAEAFEEHYFGCDICWRAVKQGAEIRSTLTQESGAVPAGESLPLSRKSEPLPPRQHPLPSRGPKEWWPALAAAAVVVVAVGLWQFQRPVQPRETNPGVDPVIEPTRGSSVTSAISASATGKALTASWPRAREARSYRVRLLTEDGRLLIDREITDTGIVISMDSVARLEPRGALYWQVEALNDLRVVVSGYALKEARPNR